MKFMEFFGKLRAVLKLKKVLNKKGIKQSWAAGRLGMSPAYLSLILSGKRRLTSEWQREFNTLINPLNGDK